MDSIDYIIAVEKVSQKPLIKMLLFFVLFAFSP